MTKTNANNPKLAAVRLSMAARIPGFRATGGAVLLSLLLTISCSNSTAPADKPGVAPARLDSYEIVGSTPHDPQAFLQGLVWYNNGFYESTGLEGRSTVRRVEYPSGKVVKSINLAPDLFGEGLAMVGDRLVQLTWKAHRGFVYDRETFKQLRDFAYDTEGWGITYDGTNLVMSDGSSMLTYLDPESFRAGRKLNVTWNGRPIPELNELEFIEGEIWANVWQQDWILRIDPETGRVKSYLDMKNLFPPQQHTGSEDVLNGIAYDGQSKRIFVSGKLWPRIYEIRVK